MKRRFIFAIGAILLTCACDRPHSALNAGSRAEASPSTLENIPPSSMPEANPAATLATGDDKAPTFVKKAALGDMFEIQSSRIALVRSKNPEVRAFANMMIQDHRRSAAALDTAVSASGQIIAPLDGLPSDKIARLIDLRSAPPGAFDKSYMQMQVDGHQQALDLMSRYANDGDVPALKSFARTVGPIVQLNLDKAKAIRTNLG